MYVFWKSLVTAAVFMSFAFQNVSLLFSPAWLSVEVPPQYFDLLLSADLWLLLYMSTRARAGMLLFLL